jgi:hypothetical protein
MHTAMTLVTVMALSLVAQSSAAPASPEAATTIELCAKLLPKGKQYTFAVNGTIDSTAASPVVHGELSLSDSTGEDLTKPAAPFAECFAKLVR